MKYYAVFDTNVIVSSLITGNPDAPTVRVVDMITDGRITPVFNQEILDEYSEVLRRPKFSLSNKTVDRLIQLLRQYGQDIDPFETGEPFLRDSDDKVFYEVVMSKRESLADDEDAYIISGNLKHFPIKPFIVTPAEMIAIIEGNIKKGL